MRPERVAALFQSLSCRLVRCPLLSKRNFLTRAFRSHASFTSLYGGHRASSSSYMGWNILRNVSSPEEERSNSNSRTAHALEREGERLFPKHAEPTSAPNAYLTSSCSRRKLACSAACGRRQFWCNAMYVYSITNPIVRQALA